MSETTIYGHHPVAEAIRAGKGVEKVFFQQGLRGEMEKEFRHLTRDFEIPLAVVPKEKLDRMVRGAHQGVVAWLSAVEYFDMETVLAEVFESGKTPIFLLLDGITDVRNFGAICRSAVVGGVHAVVVPASGCAPANEEAMKASAGAMVKVKLCRVKSLVSAVDLLKSSGLQIVSTALGHRSKPIFEVDFKIPTAIIMGSEDVGVQSKLLRMSDAVAKIPQVSDFDSLNVSVAAGVVLYEVLRQRISG